MIDVVEREERPLEEAELRQEAGRAYSDWLSAARTDVQDYLSVDDAPPERNASTAPPVQ